METLHLCFQKLCILLVTEQNFAEVDEDDIIETFMAFKYRRPDKKKRAFYVHFGPNMFTLFIFNLCNIYT